METKYKRKLRQLFGEFWSDVYETRSGSGFGYPDLQFLVGARLLPVEVKRGVVRKNGRVHPRNIRPAQISWHDGFMKAGGKSFIVVCWGKVDAMDAYALPSVAREHLVNYQKFGFDPTYALPWVKDGEVVIDLREL